MAVIGENCYIADTAVIVGKVFIDKNCSVWPCAVIRGDLNRITIGEGSNIQEHCAIHVTKYNETVIGKNVSIGHCAVIHGARIGDTTTIGMNATILDDAEIGEGCVIGAGTLLKSGMKVPPRSLVVGIPGKIVKENDGSIEEMALRNARLYHQLRDEHLAGKHEIYRK